MRLNRRPVCRAVRRLLPSVVGLVLVAAPLAGATSDRSASASTTGGGSRAAVGTWTVLGTTTQTTTPAVWASPSQKTWILWQVQQSANHFTYDAAVVSPTGALVKAPYSIFGTSYWGSLSGQPTLVSAGSVPTVVFDGARSTKPGDPYGQSCVVGATASSTPWALQPWSLSANCVNPVGGAAESTGGVITAAWPGGWTTGHGVLYRIGTSPSIPAPTPDLQIGLAGSAGAYKVAVANDQAGSGHFDIVWVQDSSGSQDGYYAVDVTAQTARAKAPGSGTASANISPFAIPAVANTNTHPGVYVVYCSNTPTCSVKLWRVGASLASTVPGSSGAADTAVSAGPSGRLWIAWYNESHNTVSIVRTNKADTRFGAVRSYATPCSEHGLLGLSSGGNGRLTVALQCVDKALKIEDLSTQTIVGLTLSPSLATVANTAAHKVSFKVTDVGDPVAGAHVKLGKATVTTGANGQATFTIPKGAPVGTFPVVASAPNYRPASARVTVVK